MYKLRSDILFQHQAGEWKDEETVQRAPVLLLKQGEMVVCCQVQPFLLFPSPPASPHN